MADVQGKLVGEFEEAKNPGDFWFSGTRLTFLCPCGCGHYGGIHVKDGPSRQGPIWQWNGDMDKPTCTPSIRFVGGCNWHGYLTDGVFQSV